MHEWWKRGCSRKVDFDERGNGGERVKWRGRGEKRRGVGSDRENDRREGYRQR